MLLEADGVFLMMHHKMQEHLWVSYIHSQLVISFQDEMVSFCYL